MLIYKKKTTSVKIKKDFMFIKILKFIKISRCANLSAELQWYAICRQEVRILRIF